MLSSPLGSAYSRTTLREACHHRPWTAYTVGNVRRGITSPPLDNTHGRQRRAWHDITALGLHARSDDVGHGMTSPPLDNTRLNDVGCGIRSSPLGSTHGLMRSGVACHNRLLAVQTFKRRQAWHVITALGLHVWSDDVGCGMTSPPLDGTHGQMT